MKTYNFKYNYFSLSMIIQLHSANGLVYNTNDYFFNYKYNNPYVNSCLINMYALKKDFPKVIHF